MVRGPVEVSRIEPDYPKELRAKHVQGEVILAGVICRDGSVQRIEVLKATDPRLEDLAVTAFRAWRYEPATLDGKPVPVYVSVVIRFTL